jgi:hypothetical protein
MNLLLNRIFQLYFDAPDGGSGGGGGEGDGSELSQDLADLESEPGGGEGDEGDGGEGEGEGDEEPKPRRRRVQTPSEGDEGEGEDAGEEEEEEPEAEVEEEGDEHEETDDEKATREAAEAAAGGRPTIKAIKAKYPDIFKDFPQLKNAMFVAEKFQEVFPDPESAIEANAKAITYDELENSLVGKADPKYLLQMLEKNTPKQLKTMLGKFSSSVRDVAPDIYTSLTTPILEEMLYYADQHGGKTGNKNLQLAAKHLANFIFSNGGQIPDITKRLEKPTAESDAEKELKSERAKYAREKFQAAAGSIETACTTRLDKVLTNKLDGLSAFEVKALVREARHEVNEKLENNKIFQQQLSRLWKQAETDGYSPKSLARIENAWLAGAMEVAPAVRNRLKLEALGEQGPAKGAQSDKNGKKRTFKGGAGGGRGKAPSNGFQDPRKIDWKKTSDLDIIG